MRPRSRKSTGSVDFPSLVEAAAASGKKTKIHQKSPTVELNNIDAQTFENYLTEALKSQEIQSLLADAFTGFSTRIDQLETRCHQLETRVDELQDQLDAQEQYSRRECLRISTPWPEKADENTDSQILQIAKDMGVDLTLDDISRSHRIGRPTGSKATEGKSSRPIIVKFKTYRKRLLFYKGRSTLRKNPNYNKVYINEDLTKARAHLSKQARDMKKNKKIKNFWTGDGNFLVKTTADNILSFRSLITFKNFLSSLEKKLEMP